LPLAESDSLRAGFAVFVGLEKDAGYCDIAERFVDTAGDFLKDVQSRVRLSELELVAVRVDEFAR
jgi:hypothetical protein